MSKKKIDEAWEKLFQKHDILKHIQDSGQFRISADEIRKEYEPRLMAKFDHTINLPKIFADNGLSILPVSRGDYLISHFQAYHVFEDDDATIIRCSLPTYIQSLDSNNILSEAIALNCAMAAGIIADFLGDEQLLPTVSGRMGTGYFEFSIFNKKSNSLVSVDVSNSQIEIDAAYEGIHSLAIIEAKRDLSDDFLVRQLYYPYRVWRDRVTKEVRPVFLIYSNGIFYLYEYIFKNPTDYSSVELVRLQKYSIEDMEITAQDIQQILFSTDIEEEPNVPFPQADKFERVINLCELLYEKQLSQEEITEAYAFDERQTKYYTDSARYLGLIEKEDVTDGQRVISYKLSEIGRAILSLGYKQRQIAFCGQILQHRAFSETLKSYFEMGTMPEKEKIVQIMKESKLIMDYSNSTYERRASTVKSWLNWIVGLINENN